MDHHGTELGHQFSQGQEFPKKKKRSFPLYTLCLPFIKYMLLTHHRDGAPYQHTTETACPTNTPQRQRTLPTHHGDSAPYQHTTETEHPSNTPQRQRVLPTHHRDSAPYQHTRDSVSYQHTTETSRDVCVLHLQGAEQKWGMG